MNKKRFLLFLAVMSLCLWTACDKKDTINPDTEGQETNTLDYITSLDSLNIATQLLYNILCAPDTAFYRKLDSASAQFNPDYGIMIYEATPSIRYAVANSFEQARHTFINDFLSPIMYLKTDTTKAEIELDLGNRGNIAFSSENGDGKVAKIDIDLKQLDNLTIVYFIQEEAWPQNGAQHIAQGNTFESSDHHNFICIKDASNGWGYLATFDLGYDNLLGNTGELEIVLDPTKGKEAYPAYMNVNMANCDQLRALQGFLYDPYGNPRAISKQTLSRIISDDFMNQIYRNNAVFLCGEGVWYRLTENKHNYGDGIKEKYYWGSNRYFVMSPIFSLCRFEDWRYDSYDVDISNITHYTVYMNKPDYDPYYFPSYHDNNSRSWNILNGRDLRTFIRMRCIQFGPGYDYRAHGLTSKDRFNRKTSY